MIRWGRALAVVAALTPTILAAQTVDVDDERSSWRVRRSVTLPVAEPGKGPAFAALVLSPEVGARCQPDLRDLRLVGPDGREVPYVIDRLVDRESIPSWKGRLVDTRREPPEGRGEARSESEWVVDLGEPRSFDAVAVEIPSQDFAKRMRVETSPDRQSWRVVREDAGVFDRPWDVRIHHTTIPLKQPVTARYLRFSTSDHRRSPAVDVRGVEVSATRRVPGEEWRRPVPLRPVVSEGRTSRYRLEVPSGLPFETLELDAADPAFSRRVTLYEVRERNGRRLEAPLWEGRLYRLRLEDVALSGEALRVPVRQRQGGELILQVHDGDSPPLRGIRASVSTAATRLLFPVVARNAMLYYGNDTTRAPVYDLESLRWRLGLNPVFAGAVLGPEAENPRFHKTPPLPFAAPRGAPLEVRRWRAKRPLRIGTRDDLYTLTLAAEDLAQLRGDLGDLRIVDESDRQVPYILEPATAEDRVDLVVEGDTRAVRRDATAVSRYRLSVVSRSSGKPLALPLSALEIRFREGFFDRRARLLAPPAPGGRSERRLFAGPLVRTADRGGAWTASAERPDPDPMVLGLPGATERELFLEINEGDNVPLTLIGVRGVVRVPRVTFKAGSGDYRVLLGNGQAPSPRYDIASLRQEVLSYSAVVVQAGASGPNPAFRRLAGDYFKETPPTLLLWATLLGAVVVLLLLTVRILKQPPA